MKLPGNQPYCRCCGKPLAKSTVKHLFGRIPQHLSSYEWLKKHAESPASLAEVQRMINGQIVRHVWSSDRSYIREASSWDGESYQSRFKHFCTVECAAVFGQLAAQVTDLRTQRAADAEKARS